MMHYSKEEWMKYVKNELASDIREEYENHLYTCDQCLDIYLEAVAGEEAELPGIVNESGFTDLIMAQIAESQPPVLYIPADKKPIRPFYQSAIFHYSIAAAMTILLMSTGVFQSITQYTVTVQKQSFQEKKTSVTEGIVDKTFAWMDSLDEKSKEDDK